eukprot:GHVQ01026414.1.p1 GENE.GHVQ01026414.1~~GHVQ01026414.1.p1  ORF type:complete len:327 (+),score=20.39 GHVQ01026414.1:1737-2717(+)
MLLPWSLLYQGFMNDRSRCRVMLFTASSLWNEVWFFLFFLARHLPVLRAQLPLGYRRSAIEAIGNNSFPIREWQWYCVARFVKECRIPMSSAARWRDNADTTGALSAAMRPLMSFISDEGACETDVKNAISLVYTLARYDFDDHGREERQTTPEIIRIIASNHVIADRLLEHLHGGSSNVQHQTISDYDATLGCWIVTRLCEVDPGLVPRSVPRFLSEMVKTHAESLLSWKNDQLRSLEIVRKSLVDITQLPEAASHINVACESTFLSLAQLVKNISMFSASTDVRNNSTATEPRYRSRRGASCCCTSSSLYRPSCLARRIARFLE